MAPKRNFMSILSQKPSAVDEFEFSEASIQSEVLRDDSTPNRAAAPLKNAYAAKNSLMIGGFSEADDSESGSEPTPRQKKSVETQWVEFTKRTVFFFLFCVTAATAGAAYLVSSNTEEAAMVEQFESFATEIVQVSSVNMENIYSSIGSMALTITSFAEDTGKTWPFVTVPHFERRGEQLLELSGAQYVSMGVLVNESDKTEWQSYSFANQGWIQEGLDVQGNGEVAGQITPYIHYRVPLEKNDDDADEDGHGPEHEHDHGRRLDSDYVYLPDEGPADPYYGVVWQMAPARQIPTLVNFNTMSTQFRDLVGRIETTRAEVLSGFILDDDETFSEVIDDEDFTPKSYLVQPVFRDVTGSKGSSDLVAYLAALLPWDNYFKNIIPAGTAPLHLVLKNTCGQVATYEIRGPEVVLLSATKDVHDPTFDALEVNTHFHTEEDLIAHGTGSLCDENEEGANDHDHSDMGNNADEMIHGTDMDHSGMDNNADEMTNGTDMDNSDMNNNADEMDMGQSLAMNMSDGGNRRKLSTSMPHEMHSTEHGCGGATLVHTAEAHDMLASQGEDLFFCWYEFSIYPTQEFEDSLKTNEPIYITIGVVVIFLVTSLVFLGYDVLVTRRQNKVEARAEKSNAIVSSLFPEQVRKRLMEAETKNKDKGSSALSSKHASTPGSALTDSGMPGLPADSAHVKGVEESTNALLQTKPIADLFPNATVLFADICGFTAWSSTREPSQVFTLLEQIYNSFDIIARRRRIFKVETIGDCYVAAAGLPEPRPDHAVAMARFANECLSKMYSVVQRLEVVLGPGTADLTMRFGIHSGPVTAGVLRGEKSRFQLFGDTVNTASRIETTGERDRIHISEATANLLLEAGKKTWIEKRDEVVTAKGKGDMITYWLVIAAPGTKGMDMSFGPSSHSGSSTPEFGFSTSDLSVSPPTDIRSSTDTRMQRLVQWNVDVMQRFLRKIEAKRISEGNHKPANDKDLIQELQTETFVIEEFEEIIELPQKESSYTVDPHGIELAPAVVSQLDDYVSMICDLYRKNSFHNFDHASHVTQSVAKLLSRIVTTDDINYEDLSVKKKADKQLHEYTFGITSDPITQFACAFSALIHDVDHSGVPNAVLVEENSEIAQLYENKSVAEQNSVDIAWELLMADRFEDLRGAIYQNADELKRFRQLVVNSVIATDIADKELAKLRKARWDKAFQISQDEARTGPERQLSSNTLMKSHDDINRKATIVIEHLIQASDVSHTMQHWHVYLKWNEKLFHEMYGAFLKGRSKIDPSKGWYRGEIGFFDFYIIPLAKKLKECGVFGVSSDEYLQYAMNNRNEWETKGEKIVEDYMSKYNASKKTSSVRSK